MNYRNRSVGISGGRRLQEGTPRPNEQGAHRLRAGGMMVRAAVVATYVQVDGEAFSADLVGAATVVYCDLLTYGNSEGLRPGTLKRVPVYTDAGLHDGRVWRPRAAAMDLVEESFDPELSQPYDLDGDHVLVEFLEDDLAQPFISRRVNHPRMGLGNASVDGDNAGHRMRLKLVDGNPELTKHHGTFYGVNDAGNFEVNTTRAHNGEYDAEGNEVPSDDATHGDVHFKVAHQAKFVVEGLDPADTNRKWLLEVDGTANTVKVFLDPDADGNNEVEFELNAADGTIRCETIDSGTPTTKMELLGASKKLNVLLGDGTEVTLGLDNTGGLDIDIDGGNTLHVQNNEADATLTLGNGAVPVAIADPYLKAQLENIIAIFNAHEHTITDGLASSATTTATVGLAAPGAVTVNNSATDSLAPNTTMDPYDPSIESTKLLIPTD